MRQFGLLLGCSLFLIGCGGQIDEVPAREEAAPVMSQEQMQKAMQESMQKGGAGDRYKPPENPGQ